MPRKLHNALTAIKVKTAGPGRHADGGGLYLRVQGGGAKSWLYRSVIGGKAKDIGLGPAAGPNALSLADARTKARELAAQAASGVMVESKRAQARKAAALIQAERLALTTFREVAESLVDAKESGWKNAKHRQQWRNTLSTYAYPVIGDLPVSEVTTNHVLQVLEPIWTTKPETASRLRGRIENVLSAAKVRRLRTGENPAAWRGHLDQLLAAQAPSKRHHPALAYAEAPAFMAELRDREAVAARALEYLILTAARVGEVIGATWAEVDLDAGIWTIPADRMKAEKEHEVPLSRRALAILEEVQPLNTRCRSDAPLFPAHDGGALTGAAMPALMKRMHNADIAAGGNGWTDRKQGRPATCHGFRSTFRDWAGEQTDFPREVIEHALAHQLADKAEAAYSRATLLPKRAKLMEAWATYTAKPIGADNVTLIGKRNA